MHSYKVNIVRLKSEVQITHIVRLFVSWSGYTWWNVGFGTGTKRRKHRRKSWRVTHRMNLSHGTWWSCGCRCISTGSKQKEGRKKKLFLVNISDSSWMYGPRKKANHEKVWSINRPRESFQNGRSRRTFQVTFQSGKWKSRSRDLMALGSSHCLVWHF